MLTCRSEEVRDGRAAAPNTMPPQKSRLREYTAASLDHSEGPCMCVSPMEHAVLVAVAANVRLHWQPRSYRKAKEAFREAQVARHSVDGITGPHQCPRRLESSVMLAGIKQPRYVAFCPSADTGAGASVKRTGEPAMPAASRAPNTEMNALGAARMVAPGRTSRVAEGAIRSGRVRVYSPAGSSRKSIRLPERELVAASKTGSAALAQDRDSVPR
jgi:hypothetical protein